VRINVRRWCVFNLVGVAGFIVQIAIITLLTRRFEWPAFWATLVALEVVAFQNFLAHRSWTWRDRPEAGIGGGLARYGRYQAAKTTMLAANLVMTTVLASAGLPAEAANLAAVLACAIPNYLLSDHLVFNDSSS